MKTTTSLKTLFVGATLAFTGIANANAAQELFLMFPGIPGASTVKGHERQIDLTGFSMNVSASTNPGAVDLEPARSPAGPLHSRNQSMFRAPNFSNLS